MPYYSFKTQERLFPVFILFLVFFAVVLGLWYLGALSFLAAIYRFLFGNVDDDALIIVVMMGTPAFVAGFAVSGVLFYGYLKEKIFICAKGTVASVNNGIPLASYKFIFRKYEKYIDAGGAAFREGDGILVGFNMFSPGKAKFLKEPPAREKSLITALFWSAVVLAPFFLFSYMIIHTAGTADTAFLAKAARFIFPFLK